VKLLTCINSTICLSSFVFVGLVWAQPAADVVPAPEPVDQTAPAAPAQDSDTVPTPEAADAVPANQMKFELKGSPEFVSEAPLEKIVGVSEGVMTLTGDFGDLKALQTVVVIPVKSMRTGNTIRDDHLRSEGWLNAKANPNVEFKTTSIEVLKQKGDATKGKAKLNAVGSITINGVSKPLTAVVKLKWSPKSVKVKTKFSVALADFDVKGSEGVVGNKVGKSIDIKAKFSVKR
jgi:polyisoprenoid-binding protein YceI